MTGELDKKELEPAKGEPAKGESISQYDELVKRLLRRYGETREARGARVWPDDEMHEAATAITALEAEMARLTAERDAAEAALYQVLYYITDENNTDPANVVVRRWHKTHAKAIAAARSRIAKERE